MTALQIHHRLIVRHPSQPAVLLTGDAALPVFTSEDRHTAEVDYINAAARGRLGLVTTVLRSLHHSDPVDDVVVRVHEVQAHAAASLPAGLWWCPHDELPARARGDDAETIAAWLATTTRTGVAPDGRDWERPGWFAEACEWIAHAVADAGARGLGDIVQRRAWMSSCVLFVPTATGEFWFKAVPESGRHEVGVTAYLAQHFPGTVAHVVATEPDRRWLLMRALDGRRLEEIDDATAWEHAAAMYGRLQADGVGHVPPLRARGCQTRALDALAAEIEPLAADDATLRRRVPELRQRCEQLAACGVPLTLEHGDLWPGNFLVDDRTCALIDWEDVAIGHPFLSLAPLLVGLGMAQPRLHSREMIERLERAYVTGFEALATPDRLRQALRLAAPLSFVDMAARYRRQRPSVVRLHPWMRDLVPQTVQLALAALDG